MKLYVDLTDTYYDSQLFNITPTNLGPLSEPLNIIKDYLAVTSQFWLIFSARDYGLEEGDLSETCMDYNFTQRFDFQARGVIRVIMQVHRQSCSMDNEVASMAANAESWVQVVCMILGII